MDPVIKIRQPAPVFTLPDMDGKQHSLSKWRGHVTIVNFWSAECPWSARADQSLLAAFAAWGENVALLPIASNANETPALIRQAAQERGVPMVLHDQQQQVARLYGAQTTPHIFVLDPAGILRYQGAYDDKTFRKRQPEVAYTLNAVNAVLEGKNPAPAETHPYGCTVVYAP